MTPRQTACYWYEWGQCREALIKLGHKGDDDQRRSLQRNALGERTISSKHLTNEQFTAVLAKFRSYSQPGNLDAQMHAQDDAGDRMAKWKAKIERLGAECGIKGGLSGVEHYFWKWLQNKKVCELDEEKLRKLAFILERRKAQQAEENAAADAKQHEVTTPPEDENDGDPF